MTADAILEALGRERGHHHRYHPARLSEHRYDLAQEVCTCGHFKSPDTVSRGRRARRLGNDQERRIERVYGPLKVGEYGTAIDHVGRWFKWQSKATRRDPPRWATLLIAWHRHKPSRSDLAAIEHMEPLRRILYPLLIRTWVRQGRRPLDVIIVRSSDWAAIHGPPAPSTEWMVLTGEYFLDIHGPDTPAFEVRLGAGYTEGMR